MASEWQRVDFDEWSQLANRDPEGFERRREALIEDFLRRQHPHRRERLRRLQWRIDRERERSGSPLGACLRLSDLMWDSFAGAGGLLEQLRALREGAAPARRRRPAEVIAFRRRH